VLACTSTRASKGLGFRGPSRLASLAPQDDER
jgi:hypothetical protein